jgi:predicted TIM-barrel fold metal-dependent hydrolase
MLRNKIDADTHVDETEATWEYMTQAESRFMPVTLDPGKAVIPGELRPHRFWLVDGRLGLRRWRADERTGVTLPQRELLDVQGRLRHMDEMGVDVQVIYPTYLLDAPTSNPEWEAAICRSYNRWLADRTAEANGRLRWVVVPPTQSMGDALEELRFGKEHGACGIFKRAVECNGKTVDNPYFFPLYEEAMRLDLAICTHIGGESQRLGVRPQIGCFPNLALNGIPDRFPGLRFGVVEAMASWIPSVIAEMKAKNAYGSQFNIYAERPFSLKEDFLRANRFYVTCQTSDDVPYLLKFGAEDGLMIGTDYSHSDQSSVIGALSFIEQLGEDGDIPMDVARKILIDNPSAFYGL